MYRCVLQTKKRKKMTDSADSSTMTRICTRPPTAAKPGVAGSGWELK